MTPTQRTINILAIVIAVVGGLIVICLLLVILYLLRNKKKDKKQRHQKARRASYLQPDSEAGLPPQRLLDDTDPRDSGAGGGFDEDDDDDWALPAAGAAGARPSWGWARLQSVTDMQDRRSPQLNGIGDLHSTPSARIIYPSTNGSPAGHAAGARSDGAESAGDGATPAPRRPVTGGLYSEGASTQYRTLGGGGGGGLLAAALLSPPGTRRHASATCMSYYGDASVAGGGGGAGAAGHLPRSDSWAAPRPMSASRAAPINGGTAGSVGGSPSSPAPSQHPHLRQGLLSSPIISGSSSRWRPSRLGREAPAANLHASGSFAAAAAARRGGSAAVNVDDDEDNGDDDDDDADSDGVRGAGTGSGTRSRALWHQRSRTASGLVDSGAQRRSEVSLMPQRFSYVSGRSGSRSRQQGPLAMETDSGGDEQGDDGDDDGAVRQLGRRGSTSLDLAEGHRVGRGEGVPAGGSFVSGAPPSSSGHEVHLSGGMGGLAGGEGSAAGVPQLGSLQRLDSAADGRPSGGRPSGGRPSGGRPSGGRPSGGRPSGGGFWERERKGRWSMRPLRRNEREVQPEPGNGGAAGATVMVSNPTFQSAPAPQLQAPNQATQVSPFTSSHHQHGGDPDAIGPEVTAYLPLRRPSRFGGGAAIASHTHPDMTPTVAGGGGGGSNFRSAASSPAMRRPLATHEGYVQVPSASLAAVASAGPGDSPGSSPRVLRREFDSASPRRSTLAGHIVSSGVLPGDSRGPTDRRRGNAGTSSHLYGNGGGGEYGDEVLYSRRHSMRAPPVENLVAVERSLPGSPRRASLVLPDSAFAAMQESLMRDVSSHPPR